MWSRFPLDRLGSNRANRVARAARTGSEPERSNTSPSPSAIGTGNAATGSTATNSASAMVGRGAVKEAGDLAGGLGGGGDLAAAGGPANK